MPTINKIAAVVMLSVLFGGCASVKLESPEKSDQAKKFATPPTGKAAIYFFRSNFGGQAISRDIWLDGDCVGRSANNVFFYSEVLGGKKHLLATESEFSPNEIELVTEKGKNYFVRQELKMGVFSAGARLEDTPEEEAKKIVAQLDLAATGNCKNMKQPE